MQCLFNVAFLVHRQSHMVHLKGLMPKWRITWSVTLIEQQPQPSTVHSHVRSHSLHRMYFLRSTLNWNKIVFNVSPLQGLWCFLAVYWNRSEVQLCIRIYNNWLVRELQNLMIKCYQHIDNTSAKWNLPHYMNAFVMKTFCLRAVLIFSWLIWRNGTPAGKMQTQ